MGQIVKEKVKLVLASSSSYRLALLRQIGLEPDLVVSPEVDESEIAGESHRNYLRRVARLKLDAVVGDYPDCCIVSADTIAVCRRKILHKTINIDEARSALLSLSGRRHRVYSCVCIYSGVLRQVRVKIAETIVRFKCLSHEELERYLCSGEWKNKAGCYGLHGKASVFVPWMSGCFHNVVGLPLFELGGLLLWAGVMLKDDECQSVDIG